MVYDSETNRYYKRPPPGEHLPERPSPPAPSGNRANPPRKRQRVRRCINTGLRDMGGESVWGLLRGEETSVRGWTDVDRFVLRLHLGRYEVPLPAPSNEDEPEEEAPNVERHGLSPGPEIGSLPTDIWPCHRGRYFSPHMAAREFAELDIPSGCDDGSVREATHAYVYDRSLRVYFARRSMINGGTRLALVRRDAFRMGRYTAFALRPAQHDGLCVALGCSKPYWPLRGGGHMARQWTAVEVVSLERQDAHVGRAGLRDWHGRCGRNGSDVTAVRWLPGMWTHGGGTASLAEQAYGEPLLAAGMRAGNVAIWDLRASRTPAMTGCSDGTGGELPAAGGGSSAQPSVCDLRSNARGLFVSRLGNGANNMSQWDLRDGLSRPCLSFTEHENGHKWLHFDTYRDVLVAGDDQGAVRVWDANTGGAPRGVLQFGSIAHAVRLGGMVEGGGWAGGMRVWLDGKLVLCGVGEPQRQRGETDK